MLTCFCVAFLYKRNSEARPCARFAHMICQCPNFSTCSITINTISFAYVQLHSIEYLWQISSITRRMWFKIISFMNKNYLWFYSLFLNNFYMSNCVDDRKTVNLNVYWLMCWYCHLHFFFVPSFYILKLL